MDFKERLAEELRTLKLKTPIMYNINDDTESLAIAALPGGTVTRSYYDNVKDKALPFEIRAKTKKPAEVERELDAIAEHIADLEQLKSKDGSFEFINIKVSDEPYYEGADETGYSHYSLGFTANITIF